MAMGKYKALACSISIYFYSDSIKLYVTYAASILDNLRFSIKSILSNINPFDYASKSRILSSLRLRLALPFAITCINTYFVCSISGISFLTTSPRSYSSKPYSVMLKFITVTRMNTSGRN